MVRASPLRPRKKSADERNGWLQTALAFVSRLVSRLATVLLIVFAAVFALIVLPESVSDTVAPYVFTFLGFVLGFSYTIMLGVPEAVQKDGIFGWYYNNFKILPVDPKNCSDISSFNSYLGVHCDAYNIGSWWASNIWNFIMGNYAAQLIIEILVPMVIIFGFMYIIVFLTEEWGKSKR